MRGFKNFKGSDASGPSMYSYSMLKSKINSLDIKLEKCLKDYDTILNQPGKPPNGHRHALLQSKTSNQELSLFPQHVKLSYQSLESNSPLLSKKSSKPLYGLRQSKTSSRRDFTQPQRKIAPFRKSPANYRPPRIFLEKESMEWAAYLKFVSQMTRKSTLV